MRKLGLIGGMSWFSTRTYYEQINRLVQKRHGPHASPQLLIECDVSDMDALDTLIADELKLGKASRSAERLLKSIITVSEQDGARAVVLACTELDLVVDVDANVLPIFDTARIHCSAAVDWICEEDC